MEFKLKLLFLYLFFYLKNIGKLNEVLRSLTRKKETFRLDYYYGALGAYAFIFGGDK